MCNFNLKTYITENKINTFIDENKSIAKQGGKIFKGKFIPTFERVSDFYLADIPKNYDVYAEDNFEEKDIDIIFKYGTEIAREISNVIPHKDFEKLTVTDPLGEPKRNNIATKAIIPIINQSINDYIESNGDLFDLYEKYKNNDTTVVKFLIDLVLTKIINTSISNPNDKFFYKTLDFDRSMVDKSNFTLASAHSSQSDVIKKYENYNKTLKVFKEDALKRKANKEYKYVYQSYLKYLKPLNVDKFDILEGYAILKWGDPIKQIKEIEEFANQTLDWITINISPEDWYDEKNIKKTISNYVAKNKGEKNKPETWVVAGYPVYPNAINEIKKYYPSFGRNLELFYPTIHNSKAPNWFEIIRSPYEPFVLERKSKVFEDLINLKLEEGLDNLAPLYSLPPQKNSDFN